LPVDSRANPAGEAPWHALLGYLNFSEGRPDPRFQSQLDDAYRQALERDAERPVAALDRLLTEHLEGLRGSPAFRDVRQVEAILRLVFAGVLPAYRQHHADLLAHLTDRELLGPFFLARVCEVVLAQGPPWTEEKRIVAAAISQLNDYVGHRPVAILESRPRGEPYDHERVRPVPLYLAGAGVACGRYHDLVERALQVLQATDPALLADAHFNPQLLDELAFDPRSYDHGHPVNRRPNYVFGEWDPDHLDNQGRYRRLVIRRLMLDALLDRVAHAGELNPQEVLDEAATVLAGIILMASGVSGWGPGAHDSRVTLSVLVRDRIPRYRDAFYTRALEATTGAHGERLRREAAALRQPFGGARQHLNQYLARHRATQLQQRQLALLFAEMGYPEASRQQALQIPTLSVRMLSEILVRLRQAQLLADRNELAAAAELLPDCEELLKRGIRCGAFADPWNILGFQGLYPLFQSREDSIRDHRIDELVDVMERQFDLYARLLDEAAGSGDQSLCQSLTGRMRRLARWWDQFASPTVSDVRRVHGGEATEAAEHVATALARWHEQGAASTGLAFWRQHLDRFHSPKAFALVVDALLRKHDYRAGMALLINWLSQAEQVPLEDGDYSFHTLALRWLSAVTETSAGGGREASGGRESAGAGPEEPGAPTARPESFGLVKKFFDYLEANAEGSWDVPRLGGPPAEAAEAEDENPFAAAYTDVTYKDSSDDGREGAVLDEGPVERDFGLEQDGPTLEKRLRFLSTVARLWETVARTNGPWGKQPGVRDALSAWLARAQENYRGLLQLLDVLHACPVPEPLGGFESMVEYDRRRVLKEQLVEAALGTCLDTCLAIHALQGGRDSEKPPSNGGRESPAPGPASGGRKSPGGGESPGEETALPAWQPIALEIQRRLRQGDAVEVRRLLVAFTEQFRSEPLLFTPLSAGGHPATILRARFAQAVLQRLLEHLPALGLLRETFALLQTARTMELAHPAKGRRITEFDRLFQLGFQGVVETVVESARTWDGSGQNDRYFVELLEQLTGPFLRLWVEHSQTLQLSSLERLRTADDWRELRDFIRSYGNDLFHAKFLTPANLRGILHRGIAAHLDYLRANPDKEHPVRLLDDLERTVPQERAVRCLKRALRAVVENYEEYKDYKATTPQSDYGQNLHMLLDFLRLKASYDRHAWQFRPLLLVHEVLARGACGPGALLWQEAFARLTGELAEQHLTELAGLEQTHGFRLRTIRDHLEERFVRPMAIDRLCVLAGPAMEEAGQPGAHAALDRFQTELSSHTATPTGVGLEVPQWLMRVQREVQRLRAEHSDSTGPRRKAPPVARVTLSYDEVKRQLAEWAGEGEATQK